MVDGKPVSSHLVGPDSIFGRISFPHWGLFRGFSSNVSQMSGKLRRHLSPDITVHHNHNKSFHCGRQWPLMLTRPKTPYIIYYTSRRIEVTERGGSVVTHETRIREVPGSNPGADQPQVFRGFPQSSRQMLGLIFITTIHLTIIHQIHIT